MVCALLPVAFLHLTHLQFKETMKPEPFRFSATPSTPARSPQPEVFGSPSPARQLGANRMSNSTSLPVFTNKTAASPRDSPKKQLSRNPNGDIAGSAEEALAPHIHQAVVRLLGERAQLRLTENVEKLTTTMILQYLNFQVRRRFNLLLQRVIRTPQSDHLALQRARPLLNVFHVPFSARKQHLSIPLLCVRSSTAPHRLGHRLHLREMHLHHPRRLRHEQRLS